VTASIYLAVPVVLTFTLARQDGACKAIYSVVRRLGSLEGLGSTRVVNASAALKLAK